MSSNKQLTLANEEAGREDSEDSEDPALRRVEKRDSRQPCLALAFTPLPSKLHHHLEAENMPGDRGCYSCPAEACQEHKKAHTLIQTPSKVHYLDISLPFNSNHLGKVLGS